MITVADTGSDKKREICLLDVVMIKGLSLIDTGDRVVELELEVHGQVVDRHVVTWQTAKGLRERLEHGWRVPPAIHWRWAQGLPAFDLMREELARYQRLLR